MNINITLLAATKSTGTSKAGKPYNVLEVAYKQDGQVKGKKLFEFKSKDICKVLSNAAPGSEFSVVQEKEGDFWEWKTIEGGTASSAGVASPVAAAPSASFPSKAAGGGNWETKEERAYKQVLIVKQSSLSQAVSSLKTDKVAADPNAVLALAQTYTDWVLAKPELPEVASKQLTEFPDDIPF